MASKQKGITLMSFILVLIVLAIFAVIAMNLFPVYSEGFAVRNALKSVAQQPNANNMDITELQRSLQRHFDVDYVSNVQGKNLKLIRDKKGNQINMTYEVRKHLVYNLDFVAMFDYTEPLSTAAPGGSD
jgi:Tfp pilus assembly major pilin PilA